MTAPCLATVTVGCPDAPTTLVCHQPNPHPGLNHYDAGELVWWQVTDAQPELYEVANTPVSGKRKVMNEDCPFCKRIDAGDYEAWGDKPDVAWFAPLSPATPGHLLFVPAEHIEDALTDPYTSAITMEIASRWAMRHRFRADGWNMITSAGTAATQTIRHLHIHLVPRREGDGLALPWNTPVGGREDSNREKLWSELPGRCTAMNWRSCTLGTSWSGTRRAIR